MVTQGKILYWGTSEWSAEEIDEAYKFASENNLTDTINEPVLCGGATPDKSGNSIIISLEKMNKIRSFNKQAKTITVDAGVILSSIHEKVEQEDLFFPLSLGAKGSCMIGGNLSTNAGGLTF